MYNFDFEENMRHSTLLMKFGNSVCFFTKIKLDKSIIVSFAEYYEYFN